MTQIYKDICANLLLFGDDDDVDLWMILQKVGAVLGVNEKKMTVSQAERLWRGASDVVEVLLHNGFIAVDLIEHGAYKAWDEQNPQQVMARIRNEWVRLKGKFPDVGYIVWFHKVGGRPSWQK